MGLGLLCALVTGVLAGTSPACLKFAGHRVSGMSYLVSFGTGAAVVNGLATALYMLYFRSRNRCGVPFSISLPPPSPLFRLLVTPLTFLRHPNPFLLLLLLLLLLCRIFLCHLLVAMSEA